MNETDQAAIEIGPSWYRIRGADGQILQEWPFDSTPEEPCEAYAGEKFCVECGEPIPTGSLYCSMDAPYGLIHWVRYFSPIGKLMNAVKIRMGWVL